MKFDIVPIGKSKGICVPKSLLDQCGFDKTVELRVEKKRLILSPSSRPREGWDDVFKAMAAAGDDRLLEMPSTYFDEILWRW